MSTQEGSWIASLSLLGALFGGPLGGVAMRYGRKRTLLAIALPFSFFWLLTVFANGVAMMYVTAFGCGFCSAVVLLVSHVYISEIASPEIRGGLCALAKMSSHVGLLVSFTRKFVFFFFIHSFISSCFLFSFLIICLSN